jgi:hypothetical protein
VLLVLLAFVPAWLCHRLVENPIRFGPRYRPTPRALRLGAGLTAIGIVLGTMLPVSARINGVLQEADADQVLGAQALAAEPDVDWAHVSTVDAIRPLPEKAPRDLPREYRERPDCLGELTTKIVAPDVCEWGDLSSDTTVVIVGDSKMNQWQSALRDLAEEQGWRMVQLTRSACPFTAATVTFEDKPWTSCKAWGRAALKKILALDPDLVITSQRRRVALPPGGRHEDDATQEAMARGLAEFWERITSAGIPLGVLLDNPSPGRRSAYECVARHPKDLSQCAFARADAIALSGMPAQLEAARLVPAVKVMDLTDVVCPPGPRCPVVIGDVLVYRQGSHITNTYAETAEPALSAALYDASGGAVGSALR